MEIDHPWNKSIKMLVIGTLGSAALVLLSYFLVTRHIFDSIYLFIAVMGLTSIQAMVQLICFLGLGAERKPHWHLISFFFMVLVIVVIVGGSLWIMYNLNYHNMTPSMSS